LKILITIGFDSKDNLPLILAEFIKELNTYSNANRI